LSCADVLLFRCFFTTRGKSSLKFGGFSTGF
jgi:hypothetical protein